MSNLLKRPELTINTLNDSRVNEKIKHYAEDLLFSVETAIKYAGYEKRELERIEKIKKLEGLKIPQHTNYDIIREYSCYFVYL